MRRTIRELRDSGALLDPVHADLRFPVEVAVQAMNEHGVGSVLAYDGYDLAGILTERDILERVVEPARDPRRTAIGQVMTVRPETIDVDATLAEALAVMRARRVCHLPALERGIPVAVISLRDIMDVTARDLAQENTQLRELVQGPVPQVATTAS